MVAEELTLFGLPTLIPRNSAQVYIEQLSELWRMQLGVNDSETRDTLPLRDLKAALLALQPWFDGGGSGRRMRELVESAPYPVIAPELLEIGLVIDLGAGKKLLTPEGVAVLHVLAHTRIDDNRETQVSSTAVGLALQQVNAVYRDWSQVRVRSTAALLSAETGTLRPAAAGLLFFLLLNRHTEEGRELPRPKMSEKAAAITSAIAEPISTYARLVGGSNRSSAAAFEVYRGWAYGEIARRLGSGFAENSKGVWLRPTHIQAAVTRLRVSFWGPGRFEGASEQHAIHELGKVLRAYESARPGLSGLGIAYERPSWSLELLHAIAAVPGRDEGYAP